MVRLKRVMSGGQTGVDRAALDAAMSVGIPTGGWCPKGRRALDGVIPRRYNLFETYSTDYRERTKLNVKDSDGTLVLTVGRLTRGTSYTIGCAKQEKPYMVVDLCSFSRPDVWSWIKENKIKVLNVAGPRQRSENRAYERAKAFLLGFFSGRQQSDRQKRLDFWG